MMKDKSNAESRLQNEGESLNSRSFMQDAHKTTQVKHKKLLSFGPIKAIIKDPLKIRRKKGK